MITALGRRLDAAAVRAVRATRLADFRPAADDPDRRWVWLIVGLVSLAALALLISAALDDEQQRRGPLIDGGAGGRSALVAQALWG
jgi:hypothetical protein